MIIFISSLVVTVLAITFAATNKQNLVGYFVLNGLYLPAEALAIYFLTPRPVLLNLLFFIGLTILVNVIVAFSDDSENYIVPATFGTISTVTLVVFLITLGIQWLGVAPTYNSIKSNSKTTTEQPLASDDQPIAISATAAKKVMNKAFSDVPNASQYNLGEVTAEIVDGKPVYVAPVERSSSNLSFNTKTPGYFIISATDIDGQPKFVNKTLNYNQSSIFNKNLHRKIYFKNQSHIQAGDPTLELDDKGNPYWVQTLLSTSTSGITKYDDIRVGVVNAETGETKVYKAKDAPSWIDNVVSPDVATDMNEGFGNPHAFNFSNTGVLIPTENGSESGVTPMFRDGKMYFFDDFTTNASNANSDEGYSLIDAKTGKLAFYTKKSGDNAVMDSDGAMSIAKHRHPQNQWHGSNPMLLSIDGHPTWVISMLDNASQFRGYIYISGTDQSIIGEGTTANEALRQYRVNLDTKISTAKSNDSKSAKSDVTGVIDRINLDAEVNNNNIVVFKLKGDTTTYTVDPDKVNVSMLTQAGDNVTFQAVKVDGSGNVTSFTNNSLQ